MTRRVLVVVSALACAAWAQPTAAPVRAEIDGVLARLEGSGCQFNRNGTWYTATRAKQHLLRKLEYMEGKGEIRNAEQFIELAASKSSISGTPYLVRCGSDAPVSAASWLVARAGRRLALTPTAVASGRRAGASYAGNPYQARRQRRL
jgi:hypothetical protein